MREVGRRKSSAGISVVVGLSLESHSDRGKANF